MDNEKSHRLTLEAQIKALNGIKEDRALLVEKYNKLNKEYKDLKIQYSTRKVSFDSLYDDLKVAFGDRGKEIFSSTQDKKLDFSVTTRGSKGTKQRIVTMSVIRLAKGQWKPIDPK